jgi:hypothetical protein
MTGTPPWTAPQGHTVALHGMKQRWRDITMRDGLTRPSAAWFLLDPSTNGEELLTTLAVTVYLALGVTTCELLSTAREPGAYTRFFAANSGLLPTIIRFLDQPDGNEPLDRYLWLGPPTRAVTAPYTKTSRAGRTVTRWVEPVLAEVDLSTVAALEGHLDRGGPQSRPARLIHKLPVGGRLREGRPLDTKVGHFCLTVAAHIAAHLPLPAPDTPLAPAA